MRRAAILPGKHSARRAPTAQVCAFGVVLALAVLLAAPAARADRFGFEPVDFGESSGPSAPPEQLAFRPGPAPAGYHVEQRSRGGLIALGGIAFAVGYGPAFALAMFAANQPSCTSHYDCEHLGYLEQAFVPVVGPALLTPRACGSDGDVTACALVAGDALVQGLGVYLVVKGLQKRPVFARDSARTARSAVRVALAPWTAGARGPGLAAFGTF